MAAREEIWDEFESQRRTSKEDASAPHRPSTSAKIRPQSARRLDAMTNFWS